MTSNRQWFAWLGLALAGCAGNSHEATESASAASGAALSSVNFDLAVAASFEGHSVRICGLRDNGSSVVGNCESELPATASSVSVAPPAGWTGGDCPCFAFDANGHLEDPGTGDPVRVTGLCPSTTTPTGDWNFNYTIYDGASCTGAVLNDTGSDFVCYDSHDLLSQENPNESIEPLAAGTNTNEIICVSSSASKEWEFLSCAISTTEDDETNNISRYSCGCASVAGACACGGLTAGDLETGCTFEAASCDILCGPAAVTTTPAGARSSSRGAQSSRARSGSRSSATCPREMFASVGGGVSSFDPDSYTFSSLPGSSGYNLEALAFNANDGLLYAIGKPRGRTNQAASALQVLRADRNGQITPVGSLTQLAGSDWTAGTFLRDGTYVLGGRRNGQPAWAKLRLGTGNGLQVVGSGTLAGAASAPASWATNPTDGRIYGFGQGRLSVFDPSGNTLSSQIAVPSVGAQSCASAFRSTGELLLYCVANNSRGSLYSVNVRDGSAQLLESNLAGAVRDLASCVFP